MEEIHVNLFILAVVNLFPQKLYLLQIPTEALYPDMLNRVNEAWRSFNVVRDPMVRVVVPGDLSAELTMLFAQRSVTVSSAP